MNSRGSKLVLSVIIALAHSFAVCAADSPLFRMRSEFRSRGVDYTLLFSEIERTDTTSVVEVIYSPARSPDHVDLLRGGCGIMKVRGKRFMWATPRPLSREPLRLEFTFLMSAPSEVVDQIKANVISLSQCEAYLPRAQL
jgi:hypothetical protein